MMARSMLSFGMLTARAASIAVRSRGLPVGSPPPALAATVISRMHLAQTPDRLESAAAFLCLICFHLLCPAIQKYIVIARRQSRRSNREGRNQIAGQWGQTRFDPIDRGR